MVACNLAPNCHCVLGSIGDTLWTEDFGRVCPLAKLCKKCYCFYSAIDRALFCQTGPTACRRKGPIARRRALHSF